MQKSELAKNWLLYFNPCGNVVIPGFVLERCPSPDCKSCVCTNKTAFQMAGALLEGFSIEGDTAEVRSYFRSNLIGEPVVSTDGATVTLSPETVEVELKKVVERANAVVTGVINCVESCDDCPETYFERSSPTVQEALLRVRSVNDDISKFRGNLEQAVSLADQMQSALDEALRLGASDLGVIVRQALAFGVTDNLPNLDTNGLIISGDLNRLRPIK